MGNTVRVMLDPHPFAWARWYKNIHKLVAKCVSWKWSLNVSKVCMRYFRVELVALLQTATRSNASGLQAIRVLPHAHSMSWVVGILAIWHSGCSAFRSYFRSAFRPLGIPLPTRWCKLDVDVENVLAQAKCLYASFSNTIDNNMLYVINPVSPIRF